MCQDPFDQQSQRRLSRQIRAIAGDIHAGQHDFPKALVNQSPYLIDDQTGRHRPAVAPAKGDDAESAAMVATILYFDKGARAVSKRTDHMRRGFGDPHDIGNPDIGTIAVQAELEIGRIIFVDIADDSAGFRHGCEHRRIYLCRTAGDDDVFLGIGFLGAADCLPGLPDRFVGHRAAVDDDQIVAIDIVGGQILAQVFAFGDIQPAAHADHFRCAHPNRAQSASPANT